MRRDGLRHLDHSPKEDCPICDEDRLHCLVGQNCYGKVFRRNDGLKLCWRHWKHIPQEEAVGER